MLKMFRWCQVCAPPNRRIQPSDEIDFEAAWRFLLRSLFSCWPAVIRLAKSIVSSILRKVPSQPCTTLVLVLGITVRNMISSLLIMFHYPFLLSFILVSITDEKTATAITPPTHLLGLVSKSQLLCVHWHMCKLCFLRSKKVAKTCLQNLAKVCIVSQSSLCIWGTTVNVEAKKKNQLKGCIFINAPCEIPLFG